MPAVFEGSTFTGDGVLALAGGGAIHVWKGLPNFVSYQALPTSGSMAMATPWRKLDPHFGLYRSVGTDLVPATFDDQLVLVVGLPAAPVLVPTGIFGIDSNFTRVNDSTAVRVTSDSFHVLRFDVTGAFLTPILSPVPLSNTAPFSFNRVSDDVLLGLSPGTDLIPGTPDDLLVMFSGLKSAPVAWHISTDPLPNGLEPEGFFVTRGGIGVMWQVDSTGLPNLDVTFVRGIPGSPLFQVILVSPPANPPSPQLTPFTPYGVQEGRGDSIIVSCADLIGPGVAHSLITDLSGVPTEIGTWYDDLACGCYYSQIGEREITQRSSLMPNSLELTKFGSAGPTTFMHYQLWSSQLIVKKTNASSLAVFSDYPGTMQGPLAVTSILRDLWGNRTSEVFAVPGNWGGGGSVGGLSWPPRIEELSPGMIAAFVTAPGSQVPTSLQVFTTPAFVPVREGIGGGVAPVTLEALLPTRVQPQSPVVLTLNCPATWPVGAGWIVLSMELQRAQPLPAPFYATGSLLQLDMSTLFAILPVSLANGSGTEFLYASGIATGLAGLDMYLQALVWDGQGTYHVSDAYLAVVY